jgi:membrane protein implicated in regulation of membrane protease activity
MDRSFLISIGIAAISCVVEAYCARLKNPIWGGIIPLLVLAASIYILATGRIAFRLTSFIIFLFLNLVLWEGWITSREKYKKKQKAELDKMKAQDLDDSKGRNR